MKNKQFNQYLEDIIESAEEALWEHVNLDIQIQGLTQDQINKVYATIENKVLKVHIIRKFDAFNEDFQKQFDKELEFYANNPHNRNKARYAILAMFTEKLKKIL